MNKVGLSFNGGKDSTVVLFLTLYFRQIFEIKGSLNCIYMKEKNPFSEIIDYLEFVKNNFDINLVEYQNENTINE